MSRWAVAGCLALAALGAVAVLDVGSPTAQAATDVSPFAGSWSGTFTFLVDYEDVGTLDWTISDVGVITGTFHNTTFDRSGTFAGRIDAEGNLVLIQLRPGDGGGFPLQGTAVIDDDGSLVASYAGTWSGGPSVVAILERN